MSVRSLLVVGVLVYCMWGLLLYLFQRNFIYMPTIRVAHDHQVERFASAGEVIEVVVLNPGARHAVRYFGGNAELVVANAPGFLDNLPGHTVYLVNYRGYSGSSGMPTEQGLYTDAQNIYDSIRHRHNGVSVIGRSLGSAVATHLASVRAVDRLVLVTPFDSMVHMARDLYPIYPVSLLLRDRFDSYSRVSQISADTLVVVAEHDSIVRAKYSSRLVGAFPAGQVTLQTIAGVGHNGLSARGEYYPLLARFIAAAK